MPTTLTRSAEQVILVASIREEQAAAVEAFRRLADAKEALMDPESSPAKRMREEQSEAPWGGAQTKALLGPRH